MSPYRELRFSGDEQDDGDTAQCRIKNLGGTCLAFEWNRRDRGSAQRRKGGSEGREVRRSRERVTTIMTRDESIP
jgi:hypothetical protein